MDGTAAARTAARSLRAHREWLVAEVASGMSLAELRVEEEADSRVGTVKVVVLVEAIPAGGKLRARRAMAALEIAADARWGELDPSVATTLWRQLAAPVPAPD